MTLKIYSYRNKRMISISGIPSIGCECHFNDSSSIVRFHSSSRARFFSSLSLPLSNQRTTRSSVRREKRPEVKTSMTLPTYLALSFCTLRC